MATTGLPPGIVTTVDTAQVVVPGNSFVRQVALQQIDTTTGLIGPLVTGSLSGFLVATATATAIPADPTFTVAGVYIGGANGYAAGAWQFTIPGSVLTASKCATVFSDGAPCYFVVLDADSSIRAMQQQVFHTVRFMTNG